MKLNNKTYTLKHYVGKVHLWLGLSSGLVVFIIAITGCIYAFQVEIQELTQSYRFVDRQDKAVLPPSTLRAIAEKELPQKHTHAVLYSGPEKAAEVIFFNFEPDYHYYIAYLNPYTGEVFRVKNMERDFFNFILDGHFYLWLPEEIGQPVTASATLIFLVMLISGIILWWPKSKGVAKQRFSVKWNARWRRKNYDLHSVFGFYAFFIAIILSVTGLVWGFTWFAQGWYTIAGGKKSLEYIEPASVRDSAVSNASPAIDRVWDLMKREYPTAETIEVHIPETDTSSIAANANPDGATYWKTDYRYFDQYSLKEQSVDHIYGRLNASSAADKLLRMNYDIHVGAILGLPGKVLAFFASLLVASLPITGCLLWWGRRNKKKDQEAVEDELKALDNIAA